MIKDRQVVFGGVDAVTKSWQKVKKIPNYAQVAGEILFRKIFEIAPVALNMYSFGPEFEGREEELYKSNVFQKHANGVVTMLDAAVNMLGPDLEPVTHALTDLGARHIYYGVLPAHYGIVGEALLFTLATALGDAWTPEVEQGWKDIYSFVSTAMIAGAERSLERKRKREERRERRKEAAANQKEDSSKPDASTPKGTRRQRTDAALPTAITLVKLTGMKSLQKEADKQHAVSDLIDEFLDIPEDIDISVHSTDSAAEEPIGGGVNYCLMVESVYTTWDQVKKIPNYAEVAGVLLFKQIFEIAPGAKALFHFTEGFAEDDEELYSSPAFLRHASSVVRMLDCAVNMLGPDLEPVTMALEELGARHVNYGVIEAHYPIVGQALLATLGLALGDAWTPTVKEGWTNLYGYVSMTMIKGAKRFTREEERKKKQKQAGINSVSDSIVAESTVTASTAASSIPSVPIDPFDLY